jgi:hypothetical protein
MRLPSTLLASFILLAFGAAGCSIKLGDKTDGEKGAVTFAYDGPGCFFGCGLDRSALQGALVSISATGGDTNVPQSARIAESSIARVSDQHETCSCDSSSSSATSSSSTSRTIEPSAACSSGETKSCSLGIDLETTAEGDAHLEIVDPKGAIIDRVVVHVRPAARIDIDVDGSPVTEGEVTTVRNGQKVKLEAHAFDANGDEEMFTKHGISHDYGDTTIVAPDPSVLIGSTDVEDMIALEPGSTTVKVYAPGTERLVHFLVVP